MFALGVLKKGDKMDPIENTDLTDAELTRLEWDHKQLEQREPESVEIPVTQDPIFDSYFNNVEITDNV